MSMLKVDLSGLNMLIEQLGDRAEAAARPASQAAAQVIYDEVKRNIRAIGHKTGNLEKGIYQVYSRSNSAPGHATYHVSWNHAKAPHGQLVEFGHIQRYASYVGSDGNWYTVKRPSSYGKPKPKRRASQAVKDAYYVTLPTPKQVAARPFVRPAMVKFPQAVKAAEEVLMRALNVS